MISVIAYLGLGTNLGDRGKNLQAALNKLPGPDHDVRVLRTSQVYETAPWGITEQPSFLNCAVEIETSLAPHPLLARAKWVEEDLGRLPGPRNGPRLIDVDILLFGAQTVDDPDLQIPHPRLHLRAFALVPLVELAAEVVHPVLNVAIADLATTVDGLDGVASFGHLS